MKKLFALMRKTTSVCAALAFAGGVLAAQPAEALTLKLGHIQSEQDFWHLGALKFKEELEARSNGKITLAIFPNSTIGGDRDLVEGMQMGTVDFGLIAGVLGNFEKTIQLLELPYLFDSQEDFNKVIHGPIGDEIAANVLKAAGVRIVNWWDRGPREVTSNKPINGLADLKGLKIRVPEIPAMVTTWRAIGANPTPMAWSEVYTGLEQNVIEAQENPIPFIYGGRIHEVQKYLAFTDHKYEYVTIAMSEVRWKSLNDEQRKIVTEAAAAATAYENKLVRDKTNELLETMKKGGLQVTHPNKAEIARAARTAHADFAKTVDMDLYGRILKALGR
ncbi:TRAP dicarboxylate transporter, DctP subunit [uncultured Alphaproteobacteria bacterium]|uniref:TRAP dicarboxylate transporter, DctP subunit n=1 Tax=uncultured Alphaproteobacteria bacterium TaxID=91750 RepID=A0A212J1M5_9PROT|nr:TRAP dicarboxylate transporter, DctP subunit [uncultured Alphaproteobacteria bacterium]